MLQFALGLAIMCLNGFVHGLFLAYSGGVLEAAKSWSNATASPPRTAIAMTASIIVVMTAHFIGVIIWAGVFLGLQIFTDPKTSF